MRISDWSSDVCSSDLFEVGTATMMAAKGAIVPVYKVMHDAGYKFDPATYIQSVTGYYTTTDGQMLSFPFNSSTPVMYYNKDAFKKAGLDPENPPKTWEEMAVALPKLTEIGRAHVCTPVTNAHLVCRLLLDKQ